MFRRNRVALKRNRVALKRNPFAIKRNGVCQKKIKKIVEKNLTEI
jgi:hypothetical protein